VAQNRQIGQRSVAREVGISQTSFCRILRENKFHSYHVQLVQEFKETDFERRLDFCHFIRTQMQVDNNFIKKILFSGEAKFSNNGSFNKHNCHYYAQENPLWIRETHFQRIVSVNVWCGIFGDNWTFFLPRKFDGWNLLKFLAKHICLWFQHDGAPTHYHRHVRQYLDHIYNHQWIGRGALNAWPPRRPDITPLDFFYRVLLRSKYTRHPFIPSKSYRNT
jgi:hypothetical protein